MKKRSSLFLAASDEVRNVGSSDKTSLRSKNIKIHDRRTSIRLEPEMWDALYEIADIESCSIHDLCAAVYDCKNEEASFAAAVRVFLVAYYRSAAFMDNRVQRIRKSLRLKSVAQAT